MPYALAAPEGWLITGSLKKLFMKLLACLIHAHMLRCLREKDISMALQHLPLSTPGMGAMQHCA
ncbi:hypothetical protein HaLaN_05546, partial [Haematococcus lacustris]